MGSLAKILTNPGTLVIVLIFGLPVIAVLGHYLVEAMKVARGDTGKKKSKELDVEETELIQQIHKGLQRMEGRIEALETILMEVSREDARRYNETRKG